MALFEGFGHRAEIDHVAVAVEQISVAREPLVEGIDRRQRCLVFDDEVQLFASDAVVFGRVLLDERLAGCFRQAGFRKRCASLSRFWAPVTNAW